MDIDLGKYSEEELLELNRRVVERIRALRHERDRRRIARFNVGDRVLFHRPDDGETEGRVVRLNQKSVTVVCNDRTRLRVPPALLVNLSTDEDDDCADYAETDPLTKLQKDLIMWAESQQRERGKA